MDRIKVYNQQLKYLFFGVLTCTVNYGVFALLLHLITEEKILLANLIAFVVATVFAYLTNKLFVFRSTEWKFLRCFREVVSFFGARVASFCMEEVGLYVCVTILGLGRYQFGCLDGIIFSKIILSFIAVILNYYASKYLVFDTKRDKGE